MASKGHGGGKIRSRGERASKAFDTALTGARQADAAAKERARQFREACASAPAATAVARDPMGYDGEELGPMSAEDQARENDRQAAFLYNTFYSYEIL